MDLSTTTALVTGARGLGRAIAAELVARGATVYAGARRPESVDLPGVVPVALDITDPASVAAAAAVTGDVALLVNNAGIDTRTNLLTSDLADVQAELGHQLPGHAVGGPGLPAPGGGGRRHDRRRALRPVVGELPGHRRLQRRRGSGLVDDERAAGGAGAAGRDRRGPARRVHGHGHDRGRGHAPSPTPPSSPGSPWTRSRRASTRSSPTRSAARCRPGWPEVWRCCTPGLVR